MTYDTNTAINRHFNDDGMSKDDGNGTGRRDVDERIGGTTGLKRTAEDRHRRTNRRQPMADDTTTVPRSEGSEVVPTSDARESM